MGWRKAGAWSPAPTAAPPSPRARGPGEVREPLVASSARWGVGGQVRIALSTLAVERPQCTALTINISRKKERRHLSLRRLLCAHEAVIAHLG